MQIVTWNVNSLKARLARVEDWLGRHRPDVLCIQESKLADEAFPAMAFEALGYESFHHGQGRWNGVAIISRVGLEDPVAGFDDDDEPDSDARIAWATCGGVRVCSVYVPNGRELTNDHYTYKLGWLARLRANLDARHDPAAPLVVTGDFNVAPEDIDVWDIAAFEGSTHVSAAEREAVGALREWGLTDLFRHHHPGEAGNYTYWDYRGGAFHKRQGMRIDLVLGTDPMVERCESVVMDREERRPKGNPAGGAPSDHAPLVATFTD